MHVQDLLARMRSRHRKRGIHPCGNRERQQACETYDPQKSGPRPRAAPRKAAGRGNATISRLYVEPRTRRRRRHTPAIAASCPPRWQSGWHRRACRIRDPGSCVENPLAGPNVRKSSTAARYTLSANFRSEQMKANRFVRRLQPIGSQEATSVHQSQHWFTESNISSPNATQGCKTRQVGRDPISVPPSGPFGSPRSPAEPHPPSLAWVETHRSAPF